MAWPFGKRRRKREGGPQPVPDPQETGSRQSPRSKRPSTNNSTPQKNVKRNQTEPLPPRASIEDITALPGSRGLGTSPHLRPVPGEQPGIPHNFRQGGPGSETPTKKLQRPQNLRSKRSDNNVQRRKSSKKRRSDPVREEEIRAMSAPIPIPKRPAGNDSGLLRRESKKFRSNPGRHADRPDSNVSLPLEDSIHSSMSGISEQRTFMVHGFEAFSPRPRLRYSSSPQIAPGSHHSRYSTTNVAAELIEPKRERARVAMKDPLKDSRTIDDLADDLDAGGLRALMERDSRRQERKRKQEEDRIRKKLQKRADKQASKESRRQRDDASPAGSQRAGIPPDEKKARMEAIGLGVENRPAHDSTNVIASEDKENQPPIARQEQPPENPFTDASEQVETTKAEPDRLARSPVQTTVEGPRVDTMQALQSSQASIQNTPPVSPERSRNESRISQSTDLRHISTLEAATPPPSEASKRKATTELSPSPPRRVGTWTSFFRRGTNSQRKRELSEKRQTPSQVSFSNTSRESMRNQIPAHLQQQAERRRSSGTPHRTQSKFREDLPELPMSPPDSRRQSPEVPALPPVPRPNEQTGSTIEQKPADPSRASPGDTMMTQRTDSPISPPNRASSALMSTSLASVDSEGSWLSGKPSRRTSRQAYSSHRLSGGESPQKRPRSNDFHGSYEELGMPDDEYFRRLTPAPEDDGGESEERNRKVSHKASSQALSGAEPAETSQYDLRIDQTLLREGVERRPTVVERAQRVKSSEGLLNQFQGQSAEEELASSQAAESESLADEPDSPLDEHEPVQIKRADSVNLKHHSRRVSAGSARLLDLPKRGDSKRNSRASSTGLSSTPASPAHSPHATFNNPSPRESIH
ncbi:MAG: hypothetical protein M1820_001028 [Bogoriella megaspora]|nr:MAG: hypothetical protein M1820_001028 [Bogoriella megaspora]